VQAPTTPSDLDLVREFKQSRSPEHFAALYRRYYDRLCVFARRVLQDPVRAQDCAQETFRKAFEEIGRFDETRPESSFWGWLVVIAQRTCLDELRHQQVEERYVQQVSLEEGAALMREEHHPLLPKIREELRKLSPEVRMCFLLFYIEDQSYNEIMEKTGFSFKQVKTYLQTARRHFEKRFQ
jgi:RNA polymerase sigma-70 factor (ECF subfamily)